MEYMFQSTAPHFQNLLKQVDLPSLIWVGPVRFVGPYARLDFLHLVVCGRFIGELLEEFVWKEARKALDKEDIK